MLLQLDDSYQTPPRRPPTIVYTSWDGEPAIFVRGPGWVKAWSVRDDSSDRWTPANEAVVAMDARVLSKQAFDAKYPAVPPLPVENFRAGPDRAS